MAVEQSRSTQGVAVEVKDLCKSYDLHSIAPWWSSSQKVAPDEGAAVWAIKNINFTVGKGETFGILGENGSGKSTLLQIISGILEPTRGSVTAPGRICPLLQLGAGFNPSFSGRENARLNAKILGMEPAEVENALPSIESFADIGQFFDQPVRKYSSGMFARLAFATAIHTHPDTLIVDEILAVGDARFQDRCYQRIKQLQQAGKTILLVTHDLNAVVEHCSRALLLEHGQQIEVGPASRVADLYISRMFGPPGRKDRAAGKVLASTEPDRPSSVGGGRRRSNNLEVLASGIPSELSDLTDTADRVTERQGHNRYELRFGGREAMIIDYLIEAASKGGGISFEAGTMLKLYIKVLFRVSMRRPMIGFSVKTVDGRVIYGTNTYLLDRPTRSACVGDVVVYSFTFALPVSAGTYFLDLGVAEENGTPAGRVVDVRRSSVTMTIHSFGHATFDGLIDLSPSFAEHRG